MKDDRNNMYFPGAQGFPQGFPQMGQPGIGGPGFPGFMPNFTQLENRVTALERQVRRLDARVTRLETPYPTPLPSPVPTPYQGVQQQPGQFTTTEIQEQQYSTYPYQTSMQVM